MIIDFHTHLVEGLRYSMNEAKVDSAVIMMPLRNLYTPKERIKYLKPEEILSGNEKVIWAKNERYIPFAWLNHNIPEATDKLRDYVQRGCRGLKLHPVLDNYRLDNPALEPLIETASGLDIPIMVHTGMRPKGSVESVSRLACEYKDAKFVIAHMKEEYGVNKRLSHMKAACKNDNIWLECSYAEHPRRVAETAREIGAERMLFGSDYPFGSKRILWDMTKVTWAPLSDKEKEMILGGNAVKLLKL
jgi:uncharacterized protein